MILEYRFTGLNSQGRVVQGTFSVPNAREARHYLTRLAQQHKLKISALERKRDFVYTINIPGKRPIRKHQLAFSKDEVASALTKMGYVDFRINEVLLDLHIRPGIQDVLMFIKLSTTMLKDRMNFGKVLEMLAEEQTNRTMKEALLQIESQLKAGCEGKEVFAQYSGVFGRFPAYMLGLATRSGNMAEVFEATGKFIERDLEIKRNIRKALISPFFAVLATLGAVGYYVQTIFPSTAELFLNYNMDLPKMTMATLDASHWLQRFGWVIFLLVVLALGIFWQWKQTSKGRVWFDRAITRVPLVGHLIHKSAIEIFFRVFATIYSGSGDNIENIRIASEACRNAWIEQQIKTITIPKMLRDGEAFVESMEAAGVFTKTAMTRLRTGQETGNILLAAEQIAVFYEAETTYKMNNLIEYIQSIIALFISLVICLLTVISAEIATISPPSGF